MTCARSIHLKNPFIAVELTLRQGGDTDSSSFPPKPDSSFGLRVPSQVWTYLVVLWGGMRPQQLAKSWQEEGGGFISSTPQCQLSNSTPSPFAHQLLIFNCSSAKGLCLLSCSGGGEEGGTEWCWRAPRRISNGRSQAEGRALACKWFYTKPPPRSQEMEWINIRKIL